MRVDLFDFELPPERIALRPADPRDTARLLVVRGADRQDLSVRELPDLLAAGDLLVFNDTRVIPAQLVGERRRDGAPSAQISATLHLRRVPDTWAAFVKGAKKLKTGDKIVFAHGFCATVLGKADAGEVDLQFNFSGADLDRALAEYGQIPLPPYIASKREEDCRDREDYQTVYAKHAGAVAAPTAGLHFTDELLSRLADAGVRTTFVTLHVGAGTFLPVKAEDTDNHRMHAEIGHISKESAAAINEAKAQGRRVIAVGTTSLRLLETAANAHGLVKPWSGETDIFITPGFKFRCVDALMTNFHLPKSTLMMLVYAFAGIEPMKAAYRHAIEQGYRFYSYGDSSLLFRANDG
ncbi:MAG: tRNA preQ1(34) S-adenosylmethionine ribosyltransferase-isomerase QueA [Pseudomonadota bacterium]